MTSPKVATFDDVLHIIGDFGRFQKIVYVMFSFPYVMTSMQLFGWVFVGAELPHRCRIDAQDNHFFGESVKNSSYEEYACSMIFKNGTEAPCIFGHLYDTSVVQDSFVKELDLVCDRRGWKATISAAPMVGYVFGGFLLGTLSDKIGRKPTFLLSDAILLMSGLGTAFSYDVLSFVACRGMTGLALAGVEATGFVMGIELVGPSTRTQAGVVCWFFETAGLFCAMTLGYFFNHDWRLLQAMYSAPCVIFLSYYWFAPESIRWLISKGRYEEARRLIKTSAKINGSVIEDASIAEMEASVEEELKREQNLARHLTFIDLFRHRQMRRKTIILAVAWIVCAALYYVLLLDQSELSENPYIGFLVTSVVQIPANFFVLAALSRPYFGRRKSLSGCLIIAGIMLVIIPFCGRVGHTKMTLSVIGRFCSTCAYIVLHLFAAEQFPTVVRGIGMGFSYVVSRVGSIVAPYILLIGGFSPLIFGLASFIAGTLSLLLPETAGKALPETLRDGES